MADGTMVSRGHTAARGSASLSFLRALDHVEEIVACTALVAVVAAVCWGVLTRYVTAQPAPWAGEVAQMGFAWVVFMGAAAGLKRGMHVSIDLLTARLPRALRLPLEIALDLGLLAFFVYVAWLGVGFTVDNWDNPSPVLRLPLSIVYASVTAGFALMALRHSTALLRRLGRTG
jgi:TRAP-type C4-dicarboxylate transport system permease small subunit